MGYDGGYDVESVRRCFSALAGGTAFFEGAGGTLVPDVVADAVAATLRAGLANRGQVTEAARRADTVVRESRAAVGDLLGCDPDGVIFGRSMTQLTYDMARTLAKTWRPGDEVVVTRLEHDANLRPWVTAAESVGATVRWVDFDPDTTELATDAIAVLTARTRLVAVTGASNLLGTRPDLPAIATAVHATGPALLYVDGVHLTPHSAVDMRALGADFFTCSPYKFCGPHLGVLAASPSLLATLRPDKLLAATDDVPERFEHGTLPYELLAGVTAAVDFLAGLVPRAGGSRRARLLTSLAALEAHERGLLARLEAGLSQIPSVVEHTRRPTRRTPTVLFSIRGVESAQVSQRLAKVGVNAPAGSFYAIEPARRIGLPDGAVRASLAPYSTAEDVDRLITAVAEVGAA